MMNLILGVVLGVLFGVVSILIIWRKAVQERKQHTKTLQEAVKYFVMTHYSLSCDNMTCVNSDGKWLSIDDVEEIANYFSNWAKEH